jgi:hypothetical protein
MEYKSFNYRGSIGGYLFFCPTAQLHPGLSPAACYGNLGPGFYFFTRFSPTL